MSQRVPARQTHRHQAIRGRSFWLSSAFVAFALSAAGCGGSSTEEGRSTSGTGGTSSGGSSSAGTAGGGTGGASTGGTSGTSSGGAPTGGTAGTTSGGTGGTSNGGTGGTATGGIGGTLSGECGQFKVDYATTLAEAKECPLFGGTPDCSVTVDNGLECPCKTSVQRSRADSLARLTSIHEQWVQKDCDALVDCRDAIGCAQPRGASCQAGGQGGDVGVCRDSF